MSKTVTIDGKTFTVQNRNEITYGAEKMLERAQFAASLSMLSDKDVEELALKSKKDGKEINEEEFLDRVMSGEIKSALLDSHDAAISEDEEAVILSVGIPRDDLLRMPSKVFKQLAKIAREELGSTEDFSEASTIDTP